MKPLCILLVASLLVTTASQAVSVVPDWTSSDHDATCLAPSPLAQEQWELAQLYWDGKGVPKDKQKALELCRKAAEESQPDAQFILGALHQIGDRVPQSNAEALKWFRKAAEQGHYDALLNFDVWSQNEESESAPSAVSSEFAPSAVSNDKWALSYANLAIGSLSVGIVSNILLLRWQASENPKAVVPYIMPFQGYIKVVAMFGFGVILPLLGETINRMMQGLLNNTQTSSSEEVKPRKRKHRSQSNPQDSSLDQAAPSKDSKPQNKTVTKELERIRHSIIRRISSSNLTTNASHSTSTTQSPVTTRSRSIQKPALGKTGFPQTDRLNVLIEHGPIFPSSDEV